MSQYRNKIGYEQPLKVWNVKNCSIYIVMMLKIQLWSQESMTF